MKKYYNFNIQEIDRINLQDFLERWLKEVKEQNIGRGKIMWVKMEGNNFQMEIEYV